MTKPTRGRSAWIIPAYRRIVALWLPLLATPTLLTGIPHVDFSNSVERDSEWFDAQPNQRLPVSFKPILPKEWRTAAVTIRGSPLPDVPGAAILPSLECSHAFPR